MAVLGVIILIVVAVVAVTVVAQGGDAVVLELPGFDIDTTAAGVFGVGAGSLLLGVLGVMLLVGGARRGNRRRKEVHRLRREVEGQPGDTATAGTGRGEGGDPVGGGSVEGGSAAPPRGRRARGAGRGRDDGEGEHFASVPRD